MAYTGHSIYRHSMLILERKLETTSNTLFANGRFGFEYVANALSPIACYNDFEEVVGASGKNELGFRVRIPEPLRISRLDRFWTHANMRLYCGSAPKDC
jgi:hypothetical protein